MTPSDSDDSKGSSSEPEEIPGQVQTPSMRIKAQKRQSMMKSKDSKNKPPAEPPIPELIAQPNLSHSAITNLPTNEAQIPLSQPTHITEKKSRKVKSNFHDDHPPPGDIDKDSDDSCLPKPTPTPNRAAFIRAQKTPVFDTEDIPVTSEFNGPGGSDAEDLEPKVVNMKEPQAKRSKFSLEGQGNRIESVEHDEAVELGARGMGGADDEEMVRTPRDERDTKGYRKRSGEGKEGRKNG